MKINKTRVSEWVLALAIVGALVLLINPAGFIMTSTYILSVLMLLGLAVIAFGVFVWREQPRDEREVMNTMRAGRVSYFVGGAVLVVAIIAETLAHTLDIWLVATLVAMVIAKLLMSAWSQTH